MKVEFEHCKELEATGLVTAIYTKGACAWVCRIEGEEEDDESLANYASVAYLLGVPISHVVRGCQQHTDRVEIATRAHGGAGVLRVSEFNPNDGFVTNEPGLVLATGEADCLPIYLLDSIHKAIGMVHSGWRGTAQLIGVRALELMAKTYGTAPQDVLVSFGPHICGNCYEVGEELLESFADNFTKQECDTFFTARDNGKFLLDNAAAVRLSLLRAGVLPEHMYDCGICTFENGEYTSYRKTRAKRPRMLTAIMLNET